ncbi:ATP-binding protein [Cryomorphaceae bacterium 1068]|nr:ATP-binding protein [Cryomorphaceae bacterium 1068]
MKNKSVRLLSSISIFSMLFLIAGKVDAQEEYFFEKLTVSDGLSNSTVFRTYQDHLGFLWVSTGDGLNRYDGYDFKTYKNVPGDSTSLPINFTQAIYEDRNNNVWVGSFGTVSKYNRQKDNFISYELDKGPNVTIALVNQIFEDQKNRLWVATSQNGVQLFDPSTNRFNGIDLIDYAGDTIAHYSEVNFQSIAELKNGNIIAASPEFGVFIYNAAVNNFQPYFPNSELNKKEIWNLYEDRSGKLWLGGQDNIFIYDPASFTMRTIDLQDVFPNQRANSRYGPFYEEGQDRMIIGSSFGIVESDSKATAFSLLSKEMDNTIVLNLFRDDFGIYWISTRGTGLYKLDPTKKPFQFFQIDQNGSSEKISNAVIDITQNTEKRDELILSLFDRDIYTYSQNANSFSKIQNEKGKNLESDKNDDLWFTADRSLNKRNLETGNKKSFPFPNFTYTREFDINNLKFGPDQKLWIAGFRGIETFDPETGEFGQLPSLMNKKASPDLISAIKNIATTKQPLSSILKVGEGANLSKEFTLNKSTKILVLTLGEGRLQNIIPNMFDFGTIENAKGETIWASDSTQNTFHYGGGYKNRISMGALDLPSGTYKITFKTDIGHSFGAFNVAPPLDSTWYGIQIFQLDENDHAYLDKQVEKELDNTYYPPFEIINDIEFSEKYVRSAWVATNGVGLVKLNLSDNSYERYSFGDEGGKVVNLSNRAQDVLEDKDGIVWVSTLGGLVRFDPETETFKIIEGLPSNQVAFMKEDLNGNLWFGTPGGISMLDKTNNDSPLSFINYDNTDGINSLPLNTSVVMTDEGKIFYGGIGGVNAFFPGSSNKTLPKPVLTNLIVSEKTFNDIADEIGLDTNISEASSVTLPYDYNSLSFEFASIHFSRPAKNKLAFMLKGIDADWNYSNRRFASYSNLPPGNYEFLIKGANGDGIWNPEISSLKISITPPWWRTWWAYCVYGILVLVVLRQLHSFQKARTIRIERQKTQQKELEQAKEVEKAYSELKFTQAQLIQSEKMASLGELTAGIAHEIQNPLNFVNNFSEVSVELLEEMANEIEKGDMEEVKDLSKNISANLQKITHHGKRADAIVKGMLAHSRSGKGEKVPTDLNALAEEYLKLSYHGLRAKDKSFNADFKTDFDPNLPKVNVVPQDIGRVLLNLINNAFQACSQSETENPLVTVKTERAMNDELRITVTDNGPGIPSDIKDKIFQPFFTTKPTGQGTGLGLSLSYDIVKAHGGEIRVESEEGEGTTFTIALPFKINHVS